MRKYFFLLICLSIFQLQFNRVSSSGEYLSNFVKFLKKIKLPVPHILKIICCCNSSPSYFDNNYDIDWCCESIELDCSGDINYEAFTEVIDLDQFEGEAILPDEILEKSFCSKLLRPLLSAS